MLLLIAALHEPLVSMYRAHGAQESAIVDLMLLQYLLIVMARNNVPLAMLQTAPGVMSSDDGHCTWYPRSHAVCTLIFLALHVFLQGDCYM